jgi:hypothetical protein
MLGKCHLLKRCHIIETTKKIFFSQKASFSLLQRYFFRKLKDNFLLKAVLQHGEQEPDKNILNSQL